MKEIIIEVPDKFVCTNDEVIRCKDCKHYNKRWKICCVDIACLHHLQHPEDYYCADAERKDE